MNRDLMGRRAATVKRGACMAALIGGAVAALAVPQMTLDHYAIPESPSSAKVYWQTSEACTSLVQYTLAGGAFTQSIMVPQVTTNHEVTVTNLAWRQRYWFRVGTYNGVAPMFFSTQEFDNTLNYTRMNCASVTNPFPADYLTPIYTNAAERILAETGVKRGMCLVYGCRDGRLAFELAKRTDMMVLGVDTDASLINSGRAKLAGVGMYGTRVTLQRVDSLDSLTFMKYAFNLIVSDRMIADGTCPGSAAEMYRVLRPQSSAFLGQPAGCSNALSQATLTAWLDAAGLTYRTTNNSVWASATQPALSNSGSWACQWGDMDNSANSHGTLKGTTTAGGMSLQWVGWPGGDFGADRQVRMPAPVSANGRMVHLGLNRMVAMDAFNGSVYWTIEGQRLMRVNIKNDAPFYTLDDRYLYVAFNDECLKFDAETGERARTFSLNSNTFEWGLVSIYSNMLVGTKQFRNAHFTNYWILGSWAPWYDARADADEMAKVCSKWLFAVDKNVGTNCWSYQRGFIINPTITFGQGRIYFVETRDGTITNLTTGRVSNAAMWNSQYLVALHPGTGTQLWEQAINTADGSCAFYLQYTDGKLFVTASQNSDAKYYIYAYSATNGAALWNVNHAWTSDNHGHHLQHPCIAGGKIHLEPNAYYLSGGGLAHSAVTRNAGCATFSGNEDVIATRSDGVINLQKLSDNSRTSWTYLRSACWMNFIFSGGLMLVPDGGAGCSCDNYWLYSVGFIPSNQ